MRKVYLLNALMNLIFGIVFVFLNNWALQNNLEETFVSLAIFYGALVVVANASYISIFCKK